MSEWLVYSVLMGILAVFALTSATLEQALAWVIAYHIVGWFAAVVAAFMWEQGWKQAEAHDDQEA